MIKLILSFKRYLSKSRGTLAKLGDWAVVCRDYYYSFLAQYFLVLVTQSCHDSLGPHRLQYARLPCPSLSAQDLKVSVPQSCPANSSVHRILQARILEWVAISFSCLQGAVDQTGCSYITGLLHNFQELSPCLNRGGVLQSIPPFPHQITPM